MNYQNKTKEDLISELQELQQNCDFLKKEYDLAIFRNKEIEEEYNTSNKELNTLLHILTESLKSFEVNTILQTALDEAIKICGLEGGTVCSVTPLNTLELIVERNTSEATKNDLQNNQIKVGQCLCGNCALAQKPLILTNRTDVLKFSPREAQRGEDIRFHAAFPLISRGITTGVLCVFTYTDKKPSERNLKLIETLTVHISRVIENANFHQTLQNNIIELEKEIIKRKQAEEAQRDSQTMFCDLVETSQDLIWQCDDEGRYIYLNPAWEEVFGYKPEEMLGKKFTDFQAPERAAIDQAEFTKLMNGNTVKGFETVHKSKTGNNIHLVFNAKYVTDEKGNSIGTRGTAYDITERIQAEASLKDSENLYRKLIENSALGMHFYSLNNNNQLIFANANPAANNLLRVDHSQFIGKTIEDAFPPLAQTEVPDRYRNAAENGISWSTEQIAYNDGKITGAYEVKAFQTTPGSMVAIFDDITKRKQMEDALQAITSKLETLIQVSPLAITLLDLEGNIQLWNPAAEKMFGWSNKEIIGHPNPIIPPDKQNEHATFSSIIFKGNSITNQETLRLHKDGSLINVSISSAPLFDTKEIIFGRMAIIADITERKKAEKELILAKEKAEESDRLKTAFLQNMSHEIRTPMNAIMGFSSLLPENYNNKQNLEKFSAIINQRCVDLLEIINDILDIAKIESGQLPINFEKCDLNELFSELQSFFKEYQERIGKQHIILNLSAMCDKTQNLIVTDKVKLKQILINLISNAIKFTTHGSIEGGCKLDKNQNIILYVTDTGIGIPLDKQKVIFDRFTQLHQGSIKNIGGTGLGLPIVKGLVDLLGGEIFLESQSGKGSTFSFSIPYKITPPIHQEAITIVLPKTENFSNKTILIVEDDLYNAQYLTEVFTNLGLNILIAINGQEAIEVSINQPIDLVLMDIRLPDIDGYEATYQIRQHKPQLAIIAQTAYASQDERQKAINAGCIDYISKPTKKETLLSIINKYLNN